MVMLIDDQPIVAEALRDILAPIADINMHYCGDAHEAVEMAVHVRPTVILLDLVMPGLDGMSVLDLLRSNEQTANLPVVMLSGAEEAVQKVQAFEHGANDYVIKWPAGIELIARIRYHSQSYQAALQRDEAYRALRESQSKLAAANLELQRLASHDGLTGVANRRYFDQILDSEWRRAMREDSWLALVMLDVDFFKRYNDGYGHQVGDQCLKRIAEAARGCLRRPADLLARYGGEEFAAVLPNTKPEGALLIAERMRQAVADLGIEHAHSPLGQKVTASVGVAVMRPERGAESTMLVAAADKALYDAKQTGKNRVIAAASPE